LTNDEKNIREFCSRHRVTIVDTNKRAHKVTKVSTRFFVSQDDYNVIDQPIFYETEKLYTVEISESELERIANFEAEVFNHMGKTGHYNLFEILMEQKENEKYLRRKFAAVQKAYENYSLMLSLANSGKLDLPNA